MAVEVLYASVLFSWTTALNTVCTFQSFLTNSTKKRWIFFLSTVQITTILGPRTSTTINSTSYKTLRLDSYKTNQDTTCTRSLTFLWLPLTPPTLLCKQQLMQPHLYSTLMHVLNKALPMRQNRKKKLSITRTQVSSITNSQHAVPL